MWFFEQEIDFYKNHNQCHKNTFYSKKHCLGNSYSLLIEILDVSGREYSHYAI